MAIPQLKESLCGCSLRTGTKIIGWVSVSLSLALLLILIFLASLDMKVLADIIGTEIGSTEEELKRDKVITVIGVFIFFAALLLIVSIFFDVMLLVGVYNDRKGFIFAWIIFQLVFLVIDLLNTISTIGHNWAGTFTDLLIACFSVYLLLIVFSHYNNLKARRSSLTSPPAYEI